MVLKFKEFIGGGEIQDVEGQLNSFIKENKNIKILDFKYNTVNGRLYGDEDAAIIYSCVLITYRGLK